MSILPRRTGRDRPIANAHGANAPDEFAAVSPVAIPHHIPRCVSPAQGFGELPRDLQKQIPYSAGISAKAKDAATARALVTFLRSPAAQDVLKRKGMDLP